jgi:hypothetical protein
VSPVKYELGFYIPEDDILHVNVLVVVASVHGITSLSILN